MMELWNGAHRGVWHTTQRLPASWERRLSSRRLLKGDETSPLPAGRCVRLVASNLMPHILSAVLSATMLASLTARAGIERLWLGHAGADPSRITICWETSAAADSTVEFGVTAALGQTARSAEPVTLHQVEIPTPRLDGPWHYRVRSGGEASGTIAVRGWETNVFRAVVVADLGYAVTNWAAAVLRERPHLLLSAGDNVPQLHRGDQPATAGDYSAYRHLIDRAPELFRTTPFMPALGNHDRELRPRGPKPPPVPVYDVEATAFRTFFALPGDRWKWTFDVPAFGVRFMALDLEHTSDFGTTWQTGHDFGTNSEQLVWFRRTMAASRQPFVLTLHNERNATVRGLAQGAWWPVLAQGSAVVSGFGYFAERALVDGVPCLNTAVNGRGARYPDPKSAFFASEDNYVLLTCAPGRPSRLELKSLAGAVLDATALAPRNPDWPKARPFTPAKNY